MKKISMELNRMAAHDVLHSPHSIKFSVITRRSFSDRDAAYSGFIRQFDVANRAFNEYQLRAQRVIEDDADLTAVMEAMLVDYLTECLHEPVQLESAARFLAKHVQRNAGKTSFQLYLPFGIYDAPGLMVRQCRGKTATPDVLDNDPVCYAIKDIDPSKYPDACAVTISELVAGVPSKRELVVGKHSDFPHWSARCLGDGKNCTGNRVELVYTPPQWEGIRQSVIGLPAYHAKYYPDGVAARRALLLERAANKENHTATADSVV